jgi:hypothetical protein
MSTWRVPAELREEIGALVPSRYSNTSAAVVDLCRRGLEGLGVQVKEQSVFSEHFYIQARRVELSVWRASHKSPGVPLVQLKLHGISYRPASSDVITSNMHIISVRGGGMAELVQRNTPLQWLIDGSHGNPGGALKLVSEPILASPNEITIEGSTDLSNVGGEFLIEVSRWDGNHPKGSGLFDDPMYGASTLGAPLATRGDGGPARDGRAW